MPRIVTRGPCRGPSDAKPTFSFLSVRRHEDHSKYRIIVFDSAASKRSLRIHDGGYSHKASVGLGPLIKARLVRAFKKYHHCDAALQPYSNTTNGIYNTQYSMHSKLMRHSDHGRKSVEPVRNVSNWPSPQQIFLTLPRLE